MQVSAAPAVTGAASTQKLQLWLAAEPTRRKAFTPVSMKTSWTHTRQAGVIAVMLLWPFWSKKKKEKSVLQIKVVIALQKQHPEHILVYRGQELNQSVLPSPCRKLLRS